LREAAALTSGVERDEATKEIAVEFGVSVKAARA
jgi:hypothetical protein